MKSYRHIFLTSFLSVAAFGLSSCGNDTGNSSGSLPCDGECAEDETCNEETNECEPSDGECTDDKDCSDDKLCIENECKYECQFEFDCKDNKICTSKGRCAYQCTENSQCHDDKICKDHRCEYCSDNNDCEGSEICKDQACVPGCQSDSQCDDGLFCIKGQCLQSCSANEDCISGICDDGACVDCLLDTDCKGEYSHCEAKSCVECLENEECDGEKTCINGFCALECTSENAETACSQEKPLCIHSVCVQCSEDSDCTGNELCEANTCKLECTQDLDCSEKDGKKCDTRDNRCYECVARTDCLSGDVCYEHHCQPLSEFDYDQDGVNDDEDVCPYNPNITTQTDADCNYTVEDGLKVFEIWHATDMIRLREELAKDRDGKPTCHVPTDLDNLVEGDCCDSGFGSCDEDANVALVCKDGIVVKENCQYGCGAESCNLCHNPEVGADLVVGDCCDSGFGGSCDEDANVALVCKDNIIVEENCQFGCGAERCNLCHLPEDGADPAAGDCCGTGFVNVCFGEKALSCKNEQVVEESCAYGCSEGSCNLCNTPEEGATLSVGDCCNADDYQVSCSANLSKATVCQDGVVKIVDCEGCSLAGSHQVFCKNVPETNFNVRLMADINLADIATGEEIKSIPFANLNVPWREASTDEEGTQYTVYDPQKANYKSFAVPDDACVMRWTPVVLENVHFDGQSHRVFFKDGENTCSLVDPFFGKVRNSSVESLTLNYNVRGLIQAMFATEVSDSLIDSVTFNGNVNLETFPALDERQKNEYVNGSTLTKDAAYSFGIVSIPNGNSHSNHYRNVHFIGNVTQVSTLSSSQISGFSGLFGDLIDSQVMESSVKIKDYVHSYNRSFSSFSRQIDNAFLDNPKTEIAWIGTAGTTNTTIKLYGIASTINKSFIVGGFTAQFGDVLARNGNLYKFAEELSDLDLQGNSVVQSGNVTEIEKDYVVHSLTDSNIEGNIQVTAGDVASNGTNYSFSDYFNGNHLKGNLTIKRQGSVYSNSGNVYGLAYQFNNNVIDGDMVLELGDVNRAGNLFSLGSEYLNNTFNGDLTIKLGNVAEARSHFYGMAYKWENNTLNGDVVSVAGNVKIGSNYYGLADYFTNSTFNGKVSVQRGDLDGSGFLFGLAYTMDGVKFMDKVTIHSGKINAKHSNNGEYYGISNRAFSSVLNDVDIELGDLSYLNYFGAFRDQKNSEVKGKLSIETGSHTARSTYIGLVYDRTPGFFNAVDIHTGDITAGLFLGVSQEISDNAATLKGPLHIEYGKLDNMGPIYGLAIDIKNAVKDVNIKYGDIVQKYVMVSSNTSYFWGLAKNVNAGTNVVSGINIEMGNVSSPFYFSGLSDDCNSPIENITLKTGNITLGSNATNKGDFDGLCRRLSSTLSVVDASFGNVFITGGYRGWAFGTETTSAGKYHNVKVEMDSLISEVGMVGLLHIHNGIIDGASVMIKHLQTSVNNTNNINNSAFAGGIRSLYKGATVKDLSFYADGFISFVKDSYSQFLTGKSNEIVCTGLIYNIVDKDVTLKNIFSGLGYVYFSNEASNIDSTTHKPKDSGRVEIKVPLLFSSFFGETFKQLETAKECERATVGDNKCTFAFKEFKNVYWWDRKTLSDPNVSLHPILMQEEANKPLEYSVALKDNDDVDILKKKDAGTIDTVLQVSATSVDLSDTFSGCKFINESCDTIWAPPKQMKQYNEPHPGGIKISIPWLKSNEELMEDNEIIGD